MTGQTVSETNLNDLDKVANIELVKPLKILPTHTERQQKER